MKCLSLWQPWATLIAIGAKRIETRSWATSYRGPLLIHTAKKWDTTLARLLETPPFEQAINTIGPVTPPLGAILCRCELVDCLPTERLSVTDLERAFGDYRPRRFGWMLQNVVAFPPVPWKGEQGLFEVSDRFVDWLNLRQPATNNSQPTTAPHGGAS